MLSEQALPVFTLNRWFMHLPRCVKRLLAMTVDLVLCALAVWLAWCLRLDQWVSFGANQMITTAVAWIISFPLFWYFGLYAAIFRYAGWNAMLALVKAATLYGLAYATVFTVIGVSGVPRSIGIIQPLLMFVALGASRVTVRLWLGGLYRELRHRVNAPGVLVYGAGAAGRQLAASLLTMSDQRLVGYVDDDPLLQQQKLNNIRVFGPQQIGHLVETEKVKDVLIALPSASHARRKQIIEQLHPHRVHVRTLPGMDTLVTHGIRASDLQDPDIEDLLGRDPVALDPQLMDGHLNGKTVLVTGAGGSIGSELCRQILRWRPRVLLLLDLSEFGLYKIHQELQLHTTRLGAATVMVPLQGHAADVHRVDEIMATWKPQLVYHAAAYKHVPLVERNPLQGLRNNVWSTLECALAADRHGVERFVLISTDKAVRPTNVMGASKRLAEMVLQALAAENATRTCYTMVRFGNVLGSSGSVVPLFRKQIASGGPITVTHRDITRFFMTIPEAAQLVIQAGAMASGGDVFVLDMGTPVRIYDLAQRMVQLTGRHVRDAEHPWGDIEIRITGLRPGEKLYEELLIGDDNMGTAHPRIMQAWENFVPWDTLRPALQNLAALMERRDHVAVRRALQQLVSGYQPNGSIMDWVQLARQSNAENVPPPANVVPIDQHLAG